jgi:hypothetical protein
MGVKPTRLSDDGRSLILDGVTLWAETLDRSDPAVSSLLSSLTKKLRERTRNPALRNEALKTFLVTEEYCRASNHNISLSLRGAPPFNGKRSYADDRVLYLATRKIAEILGSFSISEMLQKGRFGPGATFRCRGADVSKARKFGLTDVTPEFNKIARGLLAEYHTWSHFLTDSTEMCCPILEVVPGGRYSTVPKDRTTDRSIMVEPTINSWFQQGLGRMIRSRLRRKVGVDLDDQSLNRRLAEWASRYDDLATVDLSSASDLIPKKLVEDLLPPEWYFWLNITRSHRVRIDEDWIELEKFSSMGNGFTFDLQSLIFYALSWSICVIEGYNTFWVNVFGDDIVVPAGVKELFLKTFKDIGFKVNETKSYFSGPFRESCGKDFYNGWNVRGVYIKRLETDFDVMRVHNRLFEWSLRTGIDITEIRGLLLVFLEHIDARVPPALGDLGVYAHFDEVCPPIARWGWEGFRVKILLPTFLKKERADRFLILDRLQGSESAGNLVPLRLDPTGYRYDETVSRSWDTVPFGRSSD